MVAGFLIATVLLGALPAWGEQMRLLCLKCHPPHYDARGGCPGCHRGDPASERRSIAHAGLVLGRYARYTLGDKVYLADGSRLVEQYACRRCHVTAGRGNRLAMSLDAAAARKNPEALAGSIRRPVAGMPNFVVNEEQITLLVNAILSGSQAHKADMAAPVTVHFSNTQKEGDDLFTRNCGSCHRLLSERRGALGAGNIGPDLSGLFSGYYPKSYKESESWTFEKLKEWLKNPRAVRPLTTMRPLLLTADELKQLESILNSPHR